MLNNIVSFSPVGGLGDPSNENGRHSHDDAAKGSKIGNDLCCGSRLTGEDSLEVNLKNRRIESKRDRAASESSSS